MRFGNAQWVNCLPYKLEDLSSDLRAHIKLDVVVGVQNPSSLEKDRRCIQENAWKFTGQLTIQNRSCLQKDVRRGPKLRLSSMPAHRLLQY